ncbi:MAG: cell wall-binding repeat-containing protein [Clostridioides sp.]|jgi:putative cell wall-binding protein|nr:cell wall-binding repeat-containing protein [Clostridioides sp.]
MKKFRNTTKLFISMFITLVVLIGIMPNSFAYEVNNRTGSPAGHVTMTVEKFTLGQGYIREPIRMHFNTGDTYEDLIKRFLGEGNYDGNGSKDDGMGYYLSAVKDPDTSAINVPGYIKNKIEEGDLNLQRNDPKDFLSEMDYTFMSGWMYSVNNQFLGYGLSRAIPKDGDVARFQFTLHGYGKDLGDNSFETGNPYITVADKTKLTAKVGEVNSSSDKSKMLTNSGVKEAYKHALKDVLPNMEVSQKDVDQALKNIESALAEYDKNEQGNGQGGTGGGSGGGSVTPSTPSVNVEKLSGSNRYETSAKISEKGFANADNIVVVNSSSLPDALSVTPFAKSIDAPVLLTDKNILNEKTLKEIKRLCAKKVYLIGGENSISSVVENNLKSDKYEIERIKGTNRYDTSLEIADKLGKTSKSTEAMVVNGEKGLADAVSVGAISATKNMPVILTNATDNMKDVNSFIKAKDIKKVYAVGGEKLFSKESDKLPGLERIYGNDRNETNKKVIERFYSEKQLNNLYVCKNGSPKTIDLIDSLSVGVLASKTEAPILLVGSSLSTGQKELIKAKNFKTLTQVGGNGNEKAFEEIVGLVK